MDDADFNHWVDTYIRHCHSEEGSAEAEATFWVFDWILEALDGVPESPKNPEIVWKFILAVLEKDETPVMMEMLSAGALEHLLSRHGPKFIGRVEYQARQSPAFRQLLDGVWKDTIAPDIWARLMAARIRKAW